VAFCWVSKQPSLKKGPFGPFFLLQDEHGINQKQCHLYQGGDDIASVWGNNKPKAFALILKIGKLISMKIPEGGSNG